MSTQQEVDRVIKHGRIGRALIDSYNRSYGTQHRVDDCTFQVKKLDVVRVVVDFPDERRSSIPVGQLYLVLGKDYLAPDEVALFRQFGYS